MSEIKVNKISPKQTCTTVTLGDSGDDFVVATGANLKTAAVKDTAGNVIVSRCGSNITIGSSGAAIALACGATQTGFGRTGTVDWDTTAKTASFTAVSGNGYFVNTTSGAITVTLPAGSAGDIVGISDYASTFQTNNVTITPNGTDKINGTNADATLNTQGIAVSLVYVDSTRGWKSVTGSDSDTTGVPPAFITATGGTITCCGDYKIHTFTGPGTFCISAGSGNLAIVDYLVVAGGGGGVGGGGGAGGFRESKNPAGPWTASPLASATSLPVSVSAYPITVGGGGSGGPSDTCGPGGSAGSNSIFSTVTSAGGGAGAKFANAGWPQPKNNGGSGGGGGQRDSCGTGGGGTGNTPPVSPPQGNNGGIASIPGTPEAGSAGGGGGAGGVGNNGVTGTSGAGGNGISTSISASPVTRAGGGGGGGRSPGSSGGGGGPGGGGAGSGSSSGTAGTTNTGSGGGGGGYISSPGYQNGGSGGSGIVIIRYKYQ